MIDPPYTCTVRTLSALVPESTRDEDIQSGFQRLCDIDNLTQQLPNQKRSHLECVPDRRDYAYLVQHGTLRT